jgi:hypothetical protein
MLPEYEEYLHLHRGDLARAARAGTNQYHGGSDCGDGNAGLRPGWHRRRLLDAGLRPGWHRRHLTAGTAEHVANDYDAGLAGRGNNTRGYLDEHQPDPAVDPEHDRHKREPERLAGSNRQHNDRQRGKRQHSNRGRVRIGRRRLDKRLSIGQHGGHTDAVERQRFGLRPLTLAKPVADLISRATRRRLARERPAGISPRNASHNNASGTDRNEYGPAIPLYAAASNRARGACRGADRRDGLRRREPFDDRRHTAGRHPYGGRRRRPSSDHRDHAFRRNPCTGDLHSADRRRWIVIDFDTHSDDERHRIAVGNISRRID